MKLKIFLLICSAGLFFSCNKDDITDKQADTFVKFLTDGDMMIEGADIGQTSDGGYVILGTGTYEDGTTDIYLAKTDKFGQSESWSPISIGDENNDEVGKRLDLLDDGFLIFGDKVDPDDGNSDMYLVKTTSGGNITWEQTYGDNIDNHSSDIQVLDNGGFVLAGYYTRIYDIDTVTGEEKSTIDPYILETDASGMQVGVDYRLGEDESHEIPVAIRSTAAGYLVIGRIVDVTTDLSDLWMLLLPNLGYGAKINVPIVNDMDDYGVDLTVTDDGRIFFLSNEEVGGDLIARVGEFDVSALRVTNDGETFPAEEGDLVVKDIKFSPDNSLVITGGNSIAGSSDLLFLKLDLNLQKTNEVFFGEAGSQIGNAIYCTDDQGYIIAGTNSFEGVLSMIALVKTGPDGKLSQ